MARVDSSHFLWLCYVYWILGLEYTVYHHHHLILRVGFAQFSVNIFREMCQWQTEGTNRRSWTTSRQIFPSMTHQLHHIERWTLNLRREKFRSVHKFLSDTLTRNISSFLLRPATYFVIDPSATPPGSVYIHRSFPPFTMCDVPRSGHKSVRTVFSFRSI